MRRERGLSWARFADQTNLPLPTTSTRYEPGVQRLGALPAGRQNPTIHGHSPGWLRGAVQADETSGNTRALGRPG